MIAELSTTLTIADAARRSGVHPNSIRYWIERGHVGAITTPLGRVVDRESFERFLETRPQEADTRNP